jgi:hypothetical protein
MVASNHKCNKPKCENCEDPEAYEKKMQAGYEKYGWIIHAVPMNVHTHGLPEKYGHMDLQITLNINPNTAGSILHTIVDAIAGGKKFKDGDKADKIITPPYLVTFVNKTECGRDVLRVIFPDSKGKLMQDEQAPDFAKQWEDQIDE